MSKKSPLTTNQQNLTRRYLIWCYKTTKEDLDRIDRYYTQLITDEHILKYLRDSNEYKTGSDAFKKLVDDFVPYMENKRTNVDQKKYVDQTKKAFHPQYQYLLKRFEAIEASICHFLGEKELLRITDLYEQEMTQRILSAREHT